MIALPPELLITAVLGSVLAGLVCSTMGVFVVRMNLSSIGFAMSHAAFAGAAFGLWVAIDPIITALLFSFVVALLLGPISEKAKLKPEVILGIMFSLLIAMGFLFLNLKSGQATTAAALRLLWGSIFGINGYDILFLGALAVFIALFIALFYKEIISLMFHRKLAEASGINTQAFYFSILFLTGFAVSLSLKLVGGLLVYALIINPTSSVFQFTYNFRTLVIGSPMVGMATCLLGFLLSLEFDLPIGASIVLVSAILFAFAVAVSPKRRRGGKGE